MNKIGIHYAYWGSEWEIDIAERIRFASNVGFEVIDITPPSYMTSLNRTKMDELKKRSEDCNVELSFCIGFPASKDMASPDKAVREAGIEYSKRMIEAVHYMGGRMLSGILYSSWPCLYDRPLTRKDKEEAWHWGVDSVRKVISTAADCGIRYAIELVNRFEQYILNSVDEGIRFCSEVGHENAGLLVDVFHANIEEDNIADSIRKAGRLLSHMHLSENNRRLPGTGRHIPWAEVFGAIKETGYRGHLVMEPFLESFNPVGNDLRIWRDLEPDISKEARDRLAREAIAFVRKMLSES